MCVWRNNADVEQQNDRVTVRLVECSDLTIKNGSCDPFAIVTMCYSNSREESKRTKVKKKTVSPHFDEALVFEGKANIDVKLDPVWRKMYSGVYNCTAYS